MNQASAHRSSYSWVTLTGDISGGILAALIALPYGLAMASLMELPPILGLFSSILTAPITALLGRNPVLIGGVSSVTVPFVLTAVRNQGIGGAAKVTIVAAVVMLVFSVLHLGRYASRVPHAVMAGFSCGIGAMMVISQLRTILGLRFELQPDSSMLTLLAANLSRIGQTQWTTLFTALIVITTSVLLSKLYPRLPAPVLGIAVAIVVSNFFGWTLREIGTIPTTVPPFVGFSWTPQDVFTVLPAGFMLGFVASVNLLVTSRVVDHFRGRSKPHKKLDADRELGAYGIANLAVGMFGAPLSIGIPARSLANVRCGGSTRLSNFVHGLVLLAAVQYLGGFLSHVPLSALAGVTAWMGFSLMGWSTWARLPKMRRLEAAGFLATAITVVVWNAVMAVLIGCSLYAIHHLWSQRATSVAPAEAQATR
ncbi:MAG: SulP family inorganic anion transporter [Bryobacteraceae bacterium]|nr:SulP family inorganic anion transporter [Bryobacteraceae bacterium]MDW8378146.1 SulP family inorganic anion transporter [Bryobacterales bacterium]